MLRPPRRAVSDEQGTRSQTRPDSPERCRSGTRLSLQDALEENNTGQGRRGRVPGSDTYAATTKLRLRLGAAPGAVHTVVGNDLLDGQWRFRNFGCSWESMNCKLTKFFKTSIRMI